MPESAPGRITARRFGFIGHRLDTGSGELSLTYRLDQLELTERFSFGMPIPVPAGRAAALEAALDLLHWIAGVSYWKTACPLELEFAGHKPDTWQSAALTRIYREGLAEFAWRNRLDPADWPVFPHGPEDGLPASPAGLSAASLVAMGGGKDSLVALERARRAGQPVTTVQIGTSELIAQVARAAATPHRLIRRQLAPQLKALNQAGALNGHVPITAINAAILTVAAVAWDFDCVVFANERSADEPTLVDGRGRAVNHQFAKSFAFECLFDDWVRRYVATDLNVFSLLRRDRELAVCREFAGLTRYHPVFSSCNRNFHLDRPQARRWCGRCPKCHFVFLGLAPFLGPGHLVDIFSADLLADEGQLDGFRALMAFAGNKPFECVGEVAEARAALAHLARHPHWRNHAVVRRLAAELPSGGSPALEELVMPVGEHRIPARFADAA